MVGFVHSPYSGIFGPTYDNGNQNSDVLNNIIVSAAKAYSKFAAITSYFLVPNTKYFMDIPADVTAGFIEMLDDFRTKFKNWEIPDKANLVDRIKTAIICIQDAMITIEDNILLAEADNQTGRLRSKLFQIGGQAEMDALDSILVEKIESSIIALYVTLDELVDVETLESNEEFNATLRMIHRLRRKLLRMTDWNVLADLDVRIYTSRCAGIAWCFLRLHVIKNAWHMRVTNFEVLKFWSFEVESGIET